MHEDEHEVVVYSPRHKCGVRLSGVSATVWRLCDGAESEEAIAEVVASEHGAEDAASKTAAALDELQRLGFLSRPVGQMTRRSAMAQAAAGFLGITVFSVRASAQCMS